MRMTKAASLLLVLFLLVTLSSCLFKPRDFDEQQWIEIVEKTNTKDLYAANYSDGQYFNPWLSRREKSFAAFLRWQFSSTPEYSEKAWNNEPQIIAEVMDRIADLDPEADFLVWVGHATFLMRLGGEYWLTDPILTDRALVPKRSTPPAIGIGDLALLEGRLHVLISHNHYDHLDRETLEGLPKDTAIYVPQGLGDYVASFAPGKVTEMNWWQTLSPAETTKLACLPAQHWSRRIFQGYNTTLWASYMLTTPKATIYFGGDSGYFKGYRTIGEKYTSIDYALLPITAYEPRWFMHYPHMDTTEAIRAFNDLGARYFIPSQWGAFHLGDNPPGLPVLDLRSDIKELKENGERYLILDIGEIRLL